MYDSPFKLSKNHNLPRKDHCGHALDRIELGSFQGVGSL